MRNTRLQVYATCPYIGRIDSHAYSPWLKNVARWSDEAGCVGVLVYTDNAQLDPMLVSQIVVESTESLVPLVAIQPVYQHPYTIAKAIASIGHLYNRAVHLNLVAGGFRRDLLALGDAEEKPERYRRLEEFGRITEALLGGSPVTFHGDYYRVTDLSLAPSLPDHLETKLMLSGSSAEGTATARALGAVAVRYPRPPDEEVDMAGDDLVAGFRVGIIARDDADDAWRVAHDRFPPDREGQLAHQLAMKVSDSSWHAQLSTTGSDSVYWLHPFHNYKTFCPYLVGSYQEVAAELARYVALGYDHVILDIPTGPDDLHHAAIALEMASAGT